MFSVVATKSRRNSKPLLTVVPSLWVEQKSIFWLPAGLLTLSKDPKSVPDKSAWKKSKAKVLGQAETYCQAEELLISLQNHTDSEWPEDPVGTGAPKPKKGRFESKSYTLPQPTQNTDPVKEVQEGVSGSSSSRVKSFAVHQKVPTPEETILQEPAPVIFPADGQFCQLQDGTIAQIISNGVDCSEEFQPINPPCCEVNELARRMDQIELKFEKFEHIPSKIDTMLKFVADVHKFMTVRSKVEPQTRAEEDFAECEKIAIKDKRDLFQLEENLKDFEFAAKLLRFYESVYNLSGKRTGKEFFRKFMRNTVPPSVLVGFSWTGQTRVRKEGIPSNESFQLAFPSFIQFTRKLVKKADCMATDESTNSAFAEFCARSEQKFDDLAQKTTNESHNDSANRQSDIESSGTSSDEDDFPGIDTKQEQE